MGAANGKGKTRKVNCGPEGDKVVGPKKKGEG